MCKGAETKTVSVKEGGERGRAARGRVKCAYSRPARAQKFCADEGLACILLYLFPSFVEWQKAKATRKERSRQQQEDVMTS